MKSRKRSFINLFDILFVLFIGAIIALIVIFAAPTGKTVTVEYTLTVTEGEAAGLSEGDLLNLISGGSLGTVKNTGRDHIEVTAEAELHAGRYYSGSSVLKEGGEYVICLGADKLVCTLHGITER